MPISSKILSPRKLTLYSVLPPGQTCCVLPPLESIELPFQQSQFTDIIDVRSPAEFADDHIPGAINLPALTNDQRAEVGTLDKQKSPFVARRRGAALITGNLSSHLKGPLSEKGKDFTPLVYCWRGGLRSRSVATVLRSVGWKTSIVQGGYKAYRNYVISRTKEVFLQKNLQIYALSGLTGTGKTRLLHTLRDQGEQVLDLEGLADHKGSLLGGNPDAPQPSQRMFESRLLQALEGINSSRPVWTEAESNRIGKVQCPPALWQALSEAMVFKIELEIDSRARLLKADYPHFLDDPDSLLDILEHLRKLRGNPQVDLWQDQVRKRDWDPFLKSILLDHYDLSYRRPGEKSNYQEPARVFTLTDETSQSLETTANELIATSR